MPPWQTHCGLPLSSFIKAYNSDIGNVHAVTSAVGMLGGMAYDNVTFPVRY